MDSALSVLYDPVVCDRITVERAPGFVDRHGTHSAWRHVADGLLGGCLFALSTPGPKNFTPFIC